MSRIRVFPCLAVALLVAGTALAGEKGTVDEAKALLDKAVSLVEKQGEAKAIETFNDPKGGFVDRDLYVFCMNQEHKITAHVNTEMRGMDVATLKDPEGREIGKEMIALAGKGGGSFEYKFLNPATKQVEPKVSFMKKAGNQYCGVGAYK